MTWASDSSAAARPLAGWNAYRGAGLPNKALVLGAATVGGVMIYSGLAGVSAMDVLAGRASLKGSDPKGGKRFTIDFRGAGNPDRAPRLLGNLGAPSKTSAVEAVEWAAAVARRHGVDTISAFRPGSRTSTGNLSNHAGNDDQRAARDLSNTGNKGGSKEQEAALKEIMEGFGRKYRKRGPITDSFKWGDLDVEIIYRTPAYGDHRGHIHVGAHQ